MKRTVRVAFATLALLGAAVVGSPIKAHAATAMLLTADVHYQIPLTSMPPTGCPSGVLFGPPPSLIDGCAWPQNATWFLSGAGAITGSSGAVGSFGCPFFGTVHENLAYGTGTLTGQCNGGGIVGSGGITNCTIDYSRVGLEVVALVTGSGCMTGVAVFHIFPMTPADHFTMVGTMDGA